MDDNRGMLQVLVSKLLVQPAWIHHHLHLRLVQVGKRLVSLALRSPAEDGLAVRKIALAHEHRLAPGIRDGDATNSKIEGLRFSHHISRKRRPRGLDERNLHAQLLRNLLCHLYAKAPM